MDLDRRQFGSAGGRRPLCKPSSQDFPSRYKTVDLVVRRKSMNGVSAVCARAETVLMTSKMSRVLLGTVSISGSNCSAVGCLDCCWIFGVMLLPDR